MLFWRDASIIVLSVEQNSLPTIFFFNIDSASILLSVPHVVGLDMVAWLETVLDTYASNVQWCILTSAESLCVMIVIANSRHRWNDSASRLPIYIAKWWSLRDVGA